MAAKASGANPEQGRSVVPRVPPRANVQRDPLVTDVKNAQPDLAEHTRPRPGQQTPDRPTTVGRNTLAPPKGPDRTSVPLVPRQEGLRDQSHIATGQSIFDRADNRNRRLGRRNRPRA